MQKAKALYGGRRLVGAVSSWTVRQCLRFQLSPREIEELLFERSVVVSRKPEGIPVLVR
jgi:putative transposase